MQNELENEIVTVSKIQIALLPESHLQVTLSDLSLKADTATPEGLVKLMQASVAALLEKSDSWTHILASSQTLPNLEAAESVFSQLSLAERNKFSTETLTNIDGKVRQQPLKDSELDDGKAAYIVVTLLVGTADDRPLFESITSAQEMHSALEKLAAMRPEYLMVFELLWSPQVETDTLTQEELQTEYKDLMALTP